MVTGLWLTVAAVLAVLAGFGAAVPAAVAFGVLAELLQAPTVATAKPSITSALTLRTGLNVISSLTSMIASLDLPV
jgi:hypothetical protein